MNDPIRKLAAFCLLLFLSLLVSTSYIQFYRADELTQDPRNTRRMIELTGRQRGPITAGNLVVAESVPSQGKYKWQRQYPGNQMYAHLTGYFSVVQTATGLEQAEAEALTGTGDAFFYRRMADMLTGKTPGGATVDLTIDPKVQQVAWDALGNQRGAVAAIDPRTGAVLALVSKPSFDPNVLATHDSAAYDAAYKALEADPEKPLLSRAFGARTYPPGSVFKVLTAAAAIEQKGITKDTVLPAPVEIVLPGTNGQTLSNSNRARCGSNDQATLADALRASCNTPFAHLGMELGGQGLAAQAEKFGFGADVSMPLTLAKSRIGDPRMSKDIAAKTAIGQGNVQVTPLQIAMMSASVANKGVQMKPYLVKSIRAEDFTVISQGRPEQLSQPMSSRTADMLREMMIGVVTGGTGKAAAINGVVVAGKSGTAQHGLGGERKAPHAWFTSFAPADGSEAKVAVAVVIEDGGDAGDDAAGGKIAAPIAQKVMKAVLGA